MSYTPEYPRDRIRGQEAIERRREILDEVRERGKMFHEPFGQFVEATDPQTLQVFPAMHKSPIEHAQKLPNANIALIGDANHPMSPFSGNGANMALMDAVVLAKKLSSHTSVRRAITEFDEDSMPRSQKAIDKSYWTIAILHSQGLRFWMWRAVFATISIIIRILSIF